MNIDQEIVEIVADGISQPTSIAEALLTRGHKAERGFAYFRHFVQHRLKVLCDKREIFRESHGNYNVRLLKRVTRWFDRNIL